jgi:hypothetical protein
LEPYGIVVLLALLFLPNGNPPGLLGRRCNRWSAVC